MMRQCTCFICTKTHGNYIGVVTYGRKPNPAASCNGEKRFTLSCVRSAPAISKMGTARVR